MTIPIRRKGGVLCHCRITLQELHYERDGTAINAYPRTRTPGVVTYVLNNRPLLGVVALMISKSDVDATVVALCQCNGLNCRSPANINSALPLVMRVASE